MSYSSPESDWGGPRADELFQSLDQNHDNVLDRSEVRQALVRVPLRIQTQHERGTSQTTNDE